MTFGERLALCVERTGLKQKQLAEMIEVTPTRLNYWIKDKREPDIAYIRKLAKALNVSTDYLIGNTPDNVPLTATRGYENLQDSPAFQSLLTAWSKLDEQNQDIFLKFVESFVQNYQNNNDEK